MPTIGRFQAPAGVDKSTMKKTSAGVKVMTSRDTTIRPELVIDTHCGYKGNAVLNAQKWSV